MIGAGGSPATRLRPSSVLPQSIKGTVNGIVIFIVFATTQKAFVARVKPATMPDRMSNCKLPPAIR